MDCSEIVNSIGLLIDIVGVVVVYIFSPSHFMKIDGGTFSGEPTNTDLKKFRDIKFMKFGLALLILGFFLQLASNFID